MGKLIPFKIPVFMETSNIASLIHSFNLVDSRDLIHEYIPVEYIR